MQFRLLNLSAHPDTLPWPIPIIYNFDRFLIIHCSALLTFTFQLKTNKTEKSFSHIGCAIIDKSYKMAICHNDFQSLNFQSSPQQHNNKGPDHLGPSLGQFWQISGVFGFFQRVNNEIK